MRRSLLNLKLLGQSIFWKNNENILGQYLSSVSKIDHFNEFGPILNTKSVKKALKNSKLNETIVKTNVISKVPDKSKPDDSIETKYTKAVKARKIQTNKKNQVKSVETDITDCSEVKKIKSFPMFCEYRVSSIAPDYTSSADIMKFPYEYSPELPSVSRILSATMSEESKAALAKWEKEKIALLGEEGFRKFKADMFARGKTLHSMLENFLETRSLPGVADIEDQVSKRHLVSISQMIHNFDRPLAIESAMVHSDLGYSGIADCVAVINDTVTLIDWKTSERVKNSSKALYDNPLQLAAYIGAFNSDPRYEHLGNITHGAVVVVYNTGYPAMLHTFDQKQLDYDMAPLKFHKVVGFSSEDHQFPASNLLSKGKWKCKEEGEKQAWVCLQLEELSTITNIDIGNNGAAFVEVQVGRNGCDEEMKVLLVASSFMSVNEARVGDNGARVRMFGADKMAAEVAKEKWDLVKAELKIGPPKIEPKVEPKKEQVSSLGAFKLKDESESDIYIGSYFARKKENPILSSPSPSTVAAVMRSDTTLAEMTLHAGKREDKKRKQVELTPAARDEIKKRRVDKGRDFPSRLSLPGEIEEPSTSNKKEIIKKEKEGSVKKEKFKEKEKSKENEKLKENSSAKNTPQKEGKKKPHNKQKYGRFNEFLKGVNFAISGFQNPLRGEIRQKALDMGAKYSGDWNNSCTHLVCAFANTPKFNQVRGKGKIVKKEWIEECYTQRKRLPWRRFCLDRNDQNKAESEEELWEEVTAGNNDYDCDTDEEIERIKNEEEKENRKKQDKKGCTSSPSTSKTKTKANDCDNYEEIEGIENKEENDQRGNQDEMDTPSTSKTNINAYDCDTDEEDTAVNKTETQDPSKDNNSSSLNKGKEKSDVCDPYDVDTDVDDDEVERLLPNTSQLQLENLPSFYEYQTFFLHKGMKEEEKVLLNRYIIACGGEVKSYMDSSVKNVIAKELTSKELREARDVNGKINFILPTWVFACHSEGRLLNCNDYLLQE